MSTSASPLFGTEDFTGNPPVDSSTLLTNAGGLDLSSGGGFLNSLFDPQVQPVDPTNSGDTGGNQNISTPPIAGTNNPETAGSTDLGTVLNNAINAGFSAWQLASLPRNTPRTIQTTVGQTTVTAGSPNLLNSILGPSTRQQQNQLFTLSILIIIGILIYKSVKK